MKKIKGIPETFKYLAFFSTKLGGRLYLPYQGTHAEGKTWVLIIENVFS